MKELLIEESGINTANHFAALEAAASAVGAGHGRPPPELFPGGWGEMLRDFSAGVDYPITVFFEEIAADFPDAKVVLSVRSGSSWFRSINTTICSFRTPSWFMRIVCVLPTNLRRQRDAMRAVGRKFLAAGRDMATAVEATDDGWERLCYDEAFAIAAYVT
jgi:hypothetical protein